MGRKKSTVTLRAETMLADGATPAAVAKKLKLPLGRVYNIRSRAGLSAPRPKAKVKPVPTDTVESFRFSPPKPREPRTFWERLAAMF